MVRFFTVRCPIRREAQRWHYSVAPVLFAEDRYAMHIDRLPSGRVDEDDIAASINMSRRSLQRKLKQQGISFSGLLDSSRRELGLQYVRDSRHSLNEIAYLLGFSEPGNFSRAFKRWYRKSPSQYRHDSHLN